MQVSLLSQVPEPLHESLQAFLDTHPDWNQDRVFSAALALFLLQNGHQGGNTARTYLNTLFDIQEDV